MNRHERRASATMERKAGNDNAAQGVIDPDLMDAYDEDYDRLFEAFFDGEITEREFHAALKEQFGYDQADINEMRAMWFADRQRRVFKPLFDHATATLNKLPVEDRKDLRDILGRLLAEVPGRSSEYTDLIVQTVFYDSAGGTMPEEVPVRRARVLQIMGEEVVVPPWKFSLVDVYRKAHAGQDITGIEPVEFAKMKQADKEEHLRKLDAIVRKKAAAAHGEQAAPLWRRFAAMIDPEG